MTYSEYRRSFDSTEEFLKEFGKQLRVGVIGIEAPRGHTMGHRPLIQDDPIGFGGAGVDNQYGHREFAN